jgi:hypothetical protein
MRDYFKKMACCMLLPALAGTVLAAVLSHHRDTNDPTGSCLF